MTDKKILAYVAGIFFAIIYFMQNLDLSAIASAIVAPIALLIILGIFFFGFYVFVLKKEKEDKK